MLCAAAAEAQTPAKDRHVVMVSIDGFAAYAFRDPSVPLPNLRKLAREGASADAMEPVNPTVTWPNHTSIVTGVTPARHSVLYNGWAVRGAEGQPLKVEPHVDKTQLVQGVTLYDLAHDAGLTTAEVDWVAIEHAPTITWSFSEFANPDGPVEREMIAARLANPEDLRNFAKAPITQRDEMWTQAGEFIISKHKPNLLLLHLLTTDSVQHRYGARSLAAYTALALADAKLGRLIEACRAAGILPETTFVVVSDHGFKTFKRSIRPNALLKQKGLAESVWTIAEGGTAMVYVTRNADKPKTVETIRSAFTDVEGVAKVLTPADFPKYGYPTPEANPRMADLVLAAADGYAFEGSASGDVVLDVPAGTTPGAHGYLSTDPDMSAIFVASGAGIKRGVKLRQIRNLDVAPTVARLLGLKMENVSGRVLAEALQ
jgi:predicted AlkP superfamily pyrophosphatase or phosphodiesterase